MSRALGTLPCLLAIAGVAVAGPPSPKAVAKKLIEGKLDAEHAAEAWAKAGVAPQRALELIAGSKAPRGKTKDHTIKLEDGFGRKSIAHVRVPKSPRDDGRYSVLIALHGLGGNAGQLLPFVDKIVPDGTIIVAPGAQRLQKEMENEDVPGIGLSSRLPHWWSYKDESFPLRALEYVKRNYPVDTDRVYLLGYSMGGYGAWNIGLRYADRFAGIVPLAGGISRMENFLGRDTKSRTLLANSVMVPSWFAHGSKDTTVPTRFSRTIAKEIAEYGADYFFQEVKGRAHHLSGFLRGNELTEQLVNWLGERVRDPNPRHVELAALGLYHGASYWIRIDEAPKGATVDATVANNTYTITTEGVRHLTVFLDADVVDVNAPVTINVGGVELFKGIVEPSLEAVAESYAADLDPSLTYTHKVELDLIQ